jgi:hypothetical protein
MLIVGLSPEDHNLVLLAEPPPELLALIKRRCLEETFLLYTNFKLLHDDGDLMAASQLVAILWQASMAETLSALKAAADDVREMFV